MQNQQVDTSDMEAEEPIADPSSGSTEVITTATSKDAKAELADAEAAKRESELQAVIMQYNLARTESEGAKAELEKSREQMIKLTNDYSAARDGIEKVKSAETSDQSALAEMQRRVQELEEALNKACKDSEAAAQKLSETNERHSQLLAQTGDIKVDDATIEKLKTTVCASQ